MPINYNKWGRTCILGVLPGICIVLTTVFLVIKYHKDAGDSFYLSGKPLAFYTDLYPVIYTSYGIQLDKRRFLNAIDFFSKHPSRQAIFDLIYLGQQNNIAIDLNNKQRTQYNDFMKDHSRIHFAEVAKYRQRLFSVYEDIVNGVGMTFAGTGMEVVLHDTKNPLQSVQAIQNSITGRRIGDATTNFGIELIKSYSQVSEKGANFISYKLKLKDSREVKATTIPLYDEKLGLIGFICLNIDLSQVQDSRDLESFMRSFQHTFNNSKVNEIIQLSQGRITETGEPIGAELP